MEPLSPQEVSEKLLEDDHYLPHMIRLHRSDNSITMLDTIDIDTEEYDWNAVIRIDYKKQLVWNREEYNPEMWREIYSTYNSAYFGRPSFDAQEYLPNRFTVMSLNVLFDTFNPTVTNLEPRLPLIVQLFQEHVPDIVCLQEMIKKVRVYFKNNEWIQNNYIMIDTSENAKRGGQVILTRIVPKLAYFQSFDSMKYYMKLRLESEDGHRLEIMDVHLSSAKAANSDKKRAYQAAVLNNSIDTSPNTALIVGDYNIFDEECLIDNGIDPWNYLHPDDVGYTFDTENNSLAKANIGDESESGNVQGRFDRMVFVNRDMILHPVRANIIREVNGSFFSDHYALLTEFEIV